MEFLGKETVPISNYCEYCYGFATTRCAGCHVAYYCGIAHQKQHWPDHKKMCASLAPKFLSDVPSQSPNSPSTSRNTLPLYGEWYQNNVPSEENVLNSAAMSSNAVYKPNTAINPQKTVDYHVPSEEEIFSSLSNELLSSDNNLWNLINSCDAQNLSNYGILCEKNQASQIAEAVEQNIVPNPHVNKLQFSDVPEDVNIMQGAPLSHICATVIHDMNKFGICVLDKFAGNDYGNLILQEVKNLYMTGIFKKGELVNSNPYKSKESIRCDVTTWVDGTEPNCKHIGNLMRKLDLVVTTSNKTVDNGLFSKCKLYRRTKAMIACYPGDGTYYKKHIDNPHKDGRCITCIYYLNQNWDTTTHGGLLRMFPSVDDSQVANIEPIFDRMLFFWSDKRNPHEVLPSFATRFAITVWYFDEDERVQALEMSRGRAVMKSRDQQFIN